MADSTPQATRVGIDLEQERTAFEHWFSEGGKWPKSVERGQQGEYLMMAAHNGWQTWQAMVASIQQRYALSALKPPEQHSDQACDEAAPPTEHFARQRT